MKHLPTHSIVSAITVMVFFTSSLNALATINLGSAADFTILAKAGVTTTGATSVVGDIGVSPIAASSITGFGLVPDASNEFSTSSLVTGKIYAADYDSPTPSILSTAVSDMEAAYTDAAGRAGPDFLNYLGGNLGGETLSAGLYKWTSGLNINNSILLDASGDSSAVWIFQVSDRLILASNASIFLGGGANVSNIFWQTAGGATLGTDSHFEGNILTATDIAANTNATINGRLLAQTGVTLQGNSVIGVPEPAAFAILAGLSVLGFTVIQRRRVA